MAKYYEIGEVKRFRIDDENLTKDVNAAILLDDFKLDARESFKEFNYLKAEWSNIVDPFLDSLYKNPVHNASVIPRFCDFAELCFASVIFEKAKLVKQSVTGKSSNRYLKDLEYTIKTYKYHAFYLNREIIPDTLNKFKVYKTSKDLFDKSRLNQDDFIFTITPHQYPEMFQMLF